MKSALQTLIERGSPDEILENCGEYDLQTLAPKFSRNCRMKRSSRSPRNRRAGFRI